MQEAATVKLESYNFLNPYTFVELNYLLLKWVYFINQRQHPKRRISDCNYTVLRAAQDENLRAIVPVAASAFPRSSASLCSTTSNARPLSFPQLYW